MTAVDSDGKKHVPNLRSETGFRGPGTDTYFSLWDATHPGSNTPGESGSGTPRGPPSPRPGPCAVAGPIPGLFPEAPAPAARTRSSGVRSGGRRWRGRRGRQVPLRVQMRAPEAGASHPPASHIARRVCPPEPRPHTRPQPAPAPPPLTPLAPPALALATAPPQSRPGAPTPAPRRLRPEPVPLTVVGSRPPGSQARAGGGLTVTGTVAPPPRADPAQPRPRRAVRGGARGPGTTQSVPPRP